MGINKRVKKPKLNVTNPFTSVRVEPFKDEAQTALFKDPVRTAQ
jgi:hypothetical protein